MHGCYVYLDVAITWGIIYCLLCVAGTGGHSEAAETWYVAGTCWSNALNVVPLISSKYNEGINNYEEHELRLFFRQIELQCNIKQIFNNQWCKYSTIIVKTSIKMTSKTTFSHASYYYIYSFYLNQTYTQIRLQVSLVNLDRSVAIWTYIHYRITSSKLKIKLICIHVII